jgi:hypothetical protein
VSSTEPPIVEDRRRNPDRRQLDRPVEEEARYLRTAAAAAVATSGGLVVVYVFFVAVGEINLGAAAAATIVALGFLFVWSAGDWWRHRTAGPRGPQPHERERRGF